MRLLLVKRRIRAWDGLDRRVAGNPGVSIPPDPDDCHRPAGLTLFAVGEEKIGVAGRTEVADLDVGGRHAGGSKLIASHSHQIEVNRCVALGAVPGRFGGEEEQGILLAEGAGLVVGRSFVEVAVTGRKAAAEGIHHVFAYLVAAGVDAGPDRHQEVPGARAKDTAHLAHGLLNHSPGGSAPAGMHSGNGSEPGIHHQNGHAIGRPDGKQNARFVREEGIAGATLRVLRFGIRGPLRHGAPFGSRSLGTAFRSANSDTGRRKPGAAPNAGAGGEVFEPVLCQPHFEDIRRVDLMQRGQGKRPGAQCPQKPGSIAFDAGGLGGGNEAEVETIETMKISRRPSHSADSALTRAPGMNEPGQGS